LIRKISVGLFRCLVDWGNSSFGHRAVILFNCTLRSLKASLDNGS
jgi:hypothetical protein